MNGQSNTALNRTPKRIPSLLDQASIRLREDLESLLCESVLESDTKSAIRDAIKEIDAYLSIDQLQ